MKRNIEHRGTGGATHYYELPPGATELRHLIRYKKMTHGEGEILGAIYRLHNNGEHRRNLEKIIFYAQCELEYLDEKECNDD